MKKLTLALALALFSQYGIAGNAINVTHNDEHVEAGDIGMYAIPLTGLLATWIHGDGEGAKQLALSVVATQAVVHGTKKVVLRRRPNDQSNMSFPSGHTAAAFSGAAFLQSRYGAYWGVPAYVAASYVGLSRMHGNRHHADDVLASAGIAFLVNQYLIAPYSSEDIAISAMPTEDGFSLGVAVSNSFFSKQTHEAYQARTFENLKHRFELNIGVNLEDSLGKAGMPGNKLVDEHQPYAAVNYTYTMENDNQLEVDFSPNETRRRGVANENFTFQDKEYQKGEDIYLAFRQWSLGVNYYHSMTLNEKLNVAVGGGLSTYLLDLEVDLEDGGKYASDSEIRVLPSLNGKVDYEVFNDFHLVAKAQYQRWKSDSVAFAEAGIRYDLNKEWDIGFKFQAQDANWKSKSLKYKTTSVALAIANRF